MASWCMSHWAADVMQYVLLGSDKLQSSVQGKSFWHTDVSPAHYKVVTRKKVNLKHIKHHI